MAWPENPLGTALPAPDPARYGTLVAHDTMTVQPGTGTTRYTTMRDPADMPLGTGWETLKVGGGAGDLATVDTWGGQRADMSQDQPVNGAVIEPPAPNAEMVVIWCYRNHANDSQPWTAFRCRIPAAGTLQFLCLRHTFTHFQMWEHDNGTWALLGDDPSLQGPAAGTSAVVCRCTGDLVEFSDANDPDTILYSQTLTQFQTADHRYAGISSWVGSRQHEIQVYDNVAAGPGDGAVVVAGQQQIAGGP